MNPLSVNLIRTYVPVLVGAVASWLTARGIHLQPQQTAFAVATLTATFSAAYYTVVRVLEERFPVLGKVLLLSRPAVSLHVAGECPAQAEDYGEGWPPRDDNAVEAERVQAAYERLMPQSAPSQAPAPVFQPSASVSHLAAPVPPLGTTGHLTVAPQGFNPPATEGPQTTAWRAAETRPEPLRVRKADTGAIPAYRRPPGR